MGKLVIIIVLYAVFIKLCSLYLKSNSKRKKDIVGKGSSIIQNTESKADIVGKSKFDLSESKPLSSKSKPLTATSLKTEKESENPNIFAPPNEDKPSVEIPQDELDDVFSETSLDDKNEPMDIDYPLEYYEAEEDEYEEEDETEEVEGTAQASLASGVKFEDLGNAIQTINKTDEATPEQKQRAGNTLLEIRQTDMFEQVISSKPDAKRIVNDLMSESLAEFNRRKDKETGVDGNEKKAPTDFNIRDFA